MYQDRISSSPLVQEEYKSLTRDYTTAQTFYDDLLKKMNDSKMATDLEKRQQGEQFRVMDEPNLPDGPSFPKRGVFARRWSGCRALPGADDCGVDGVQGHGTSERAGYMGLYEATDAVRYRFCRRDAEPVKAKRRWKFWQRKPNMAAAGKPLVNAGG